MNRDDLRHTRGGRIWLSWLGRIDWPIALLIVLLMAASLMILHSASSQAHIVFRQSLRFAAAWAVFFLILAFPPRLIPRMTPWLYLVTVSLLALVPLIGVSAGGAQRWLNLGIARLQPSEIAKLSVPMMVAYLLTRQVRRASLARFVSAILLVSLPVVLIAIEPDLGTAILVAAAGGIALFFAGLPWSFIGVCAILLAFAMPLFWFFGIRDYQRERIMMLFQPEADPFGAGYHIIQSQIAIGSGGLTGKGYLHGTQSQLAFLPEASTDFVFAVLAEEHGLLGVSVLLGVYLLIILRGLYLAARLQNRFARVLAASVFLNFFLNIFVNIGMVSGFLPVVGLPLALISYGGSSVISLMVGFAVVINLIGSDKSSVAQGQL